MDLSFEVSGQFTQIVALLRLVNRGSSSWSRTFVPVKFTVCFDSSKNCSSFQFVISARSLSDNSCLAKFLSKGTGMLFCALFVSVRSIVQLVFLNFKSSFMIF